jgi:putative endonuclease
MGFWRKVMERGRDPRHALGKRGEDEAARYLQKLGYEIVGRNIRTRLGELDLIARDRGVLVFVEVKTRSSGEFAAPELSVDGRKRRKLYDLALAYLSNLGEPADCRFDVLGIILRPRGQPAIRHIQDAFRVEPK